MKYTDKELIRASQIAYLTVNQTVLKEAYDETERINKDNPNANIDLNYTLSELYKYSSAFRYNIYDEISKTAGFTVTESSDSKNVLDCIESDVTRQMVAEKYAIIDDITSGEIGSWKVVSYVDNNAIDNAGMAGKLVNGKWDHKSFSKTGDGLAAMVFETGDGRTITAFRGSEGAPHLIRNWKDALSDWIAADVGLGLSDKDTAQQESVYKYMEDYVLNLGYDDITLTGHSLGGNLAMHAAVSANEIPSAKAKSISNVVSFDGPGFSDGYMLRHSFAISTINETRKTILAHYTWSVVGVLLNQIRGTYDQKTHVGAFDIKLNAGERHDMAFAQYGDNDNLLSATKNDKDKLIFWEIADELLINNLVRIPESSRSAFLSFLFLLIESSVNSMKDKSDVESIFDFCVSSICGQAEKNCCFFFSGFLTPVIYNFFTNSIYHSFVDNTYRLSELLAEDKHENIVISRRNVCCQN